MAPLHCGVEMRAPELPAPDWQRYGVSLERPDAPSTR